MKLLKGDPEGKAVFGVSGQKRKNGRRENRQMQRPAGKAKTGGQKKKQKAK